MPPTLNQLLKSMVEQGGSDLHITTNSPPQVRVDGHLRQLNLPPMTPGETKSLAYSILTDNQKHRLEETLEIDLSFGIKGLARFRANIFHQRGAVAAVFRQIPYEIKTFRELGLPTIIERLCEKPRGLILVTGPTGSGKSTTLAAMIDKINRERAEHIVTIEDPVEYLHSHKKCIVNQREVMADTYSFTAALRSALRQDPDVVLIGEMRDLETVEAALRIAETGHLTFATLHTNSAAQTINRIIDVFPAHQQAQIRAQLSLVLEGIVCQALLPKTGGKGRAMAMEILIPSSAIRNLIREDKVHQIYGMMQAGQAKHGMQTFNQSLASPLLQAHDHAGGGARPFVLSGRVAGDHQPRSGQPEPQPDRVGGRSRKMPSFVWKGKTRAGQVQEGQLLADSRDAAAAVLRRQQIQITSIKEKGKEIKLIPRFSRGIKAKRIAIFTRQFSVMLDAGLPLVQCLEILGDQEESRNFQAIIQQVRTDVESGASLADAMRKHPKAFDALFTNMVAAGESGGILDIILQRLSTYIEKAVKLNSQVKAALIYPVSIILIAALVVFIILWKVIPVFAQLFAGLGGEMPLLTRIVIGASNFVADYFFFILIVVVAGYVAVNRWHRTPHGRRLLDSAMLKIPVVGMLLRKIAVARFCRTLGTLTASGVPILDGLEITAKTAGNATIEDAVMAVRKSVEEGKTISEPLAQTKVFPSMVVQMINVGEQTGALDQMLAKVADFYEDEVDTAVAGLMKLIEPVMITVLGGIIGTIVAAMYLPLYSVLSKIG